jgi:hypothetical protein
MSSADIEGGCSNDYFREMVLTIVPTGHLRLSLALSFPRMQGQQRIKRRNGHLR